MTTAILPKTLPKLSPLGKELRVEQERIARVYYQAKLEEIVQPFDSRISFRTNSDETTEDFITNVSPTDDVAGLNAADDQVTSKELFNWLDAGTDIRYVGMPDEFSNETSPNSLNTSHADYNRNDIFFLKEPTVGIDARQFLKQIDELYRNLYRTQMINTISNYIEKL